MAAGEPADRADRGIASQVALARRVSPFHAQRYVGWSTILTSELPQTLTALQAGKVSEWRAMLVARETAWLSREHRAQVDAELAPRLEHLGDRKVEAEARKLGYRLDPHGYLARTKGAEQDRYVSLRPAPDAMTRLTGFLPVAQGVAARAVLSRDADALITAGDGRTHGQLMADLMVERLTGQTTATAVPVEVEVVIDVDTLLGNTDEPAHVSGYGPIPTEAARDLITRPEQAWLRRLFRHPTSGELITMESRRRLFTENQRRFIRLRDQTCRTPWCDAPIRHTDHILPAEAGGTTSIANGQGLCAACNYAKQAEGWHAKPQAGDILITTPTGHRYRGRAPDPPRGAAESRLQRRIRQLLAAA